ncbi:DUF2459 domain-containing protein [Psychroflexus aestuariivivens]|uniref:DUF2459 domain-containing protein n=1 Tax=Psychroflexus aestuariivivens TaxID=1795040 RepID=UPI000FD972F3|nr:DUF2459 domain-containing protein [Psychroflexus aestuariivivens]
MKIFKTIFKWILYVLLIPVLYFVISLILTAITVDRNEIEETPTQTIYLSTNGIHLDIVIPKENIDSSLLKNLVHKSQDEYFAFGWGDENFYLNTPSWSDLSFKTAFNATFLKTSTLVHVTRYKIENKDWVEIKITESELNKLCAYILKAFALNSKGEKVLIENIGYTTTDDFYKAKGSYSLFKTSNSWVNTGFKKSGLKSCLWTPFDFGLINKYR